MIELLLERTTVIGFAIAGGVFSILASWCQSRGSLSEKNIKWLNKTSYVFMAVSMILFIVAGMTNSGS